MLRSGLKILLPIVLLLLSAAFVLQLFDTEEDSPETAMAERAWPVEAMTVAHAAHRPVLRLQGHLESPALARLRSAVAADVEAVLAREGDVVDVGQVLVQLDRDELALVVREREAELVDLQARLTLEQQRIDADREGLAIEESLLDVREREVERITNLANEALASPSDVDTVVRGLQQQQLAVNARRLAVAGADARVAQSQAAIDRSQALLDRARRDLDRTHLRAPFTGRVTAVEMAVGDRAAPGDVVVSLYPLEALEVRATLLSRHIPQVRAALAEGPLPAVAVVDGLSVDARLERLAGQSARGSGGVEVLFAIDQSDDLQLGRFVDIEVLLPAQDETILLPFEALYQTDRVFLVDDGRLRTVPVERLGEARTDNGRRGAVVRGALDDGDVLIITQLPQAIDGLPVSIERLDGEPR